MLEMVRADLKSGELGYWGIIGKDVVQLLTYNNVPGHNTTFRTGPPDGYKFLLFISHI